MGKIKRKAKPKKCPETGVSLKGKDRDAYAFSVWHVLVSQIATLSPKAQERYLKVIGYDPKDNEKTEGE